MSTTVSAQAPVDLCSDYIAATLHRIIVCHLLVHPSNEDIFFHVSGHRGQCFIRDQLQCLGFIQGQPTNYSQVF